MQVGTWGKARGVPVLASGLPRGFGSLGYLSMMDKWALDIKKELTMTTKNKNKLRRR